MVTKTKLDHQSIWEYIRRIRAEYHRMNPVEPSEGCDGFINQSLIDSNFELLLVNLKVSNVSDQIQELSKEKIDDIGKMFIYLNACPLDLAYFYHHLFLERSNTEIILLLLNSQKKSVRNGLKFAASKILGKVAQRFGFQFNQPSNDQKWTKHFDKVQSKFTFCTLLIKI